MSKSKTHKYIESYIGELCKDQKKELKGIGVRKLSDLLFLEESIINEMSNFTEIQKRKLLMIANYKKKAKDDWDPHLTQEEMYKYLDTKNRKDRRGIESTKVLMDAIERLNFTTKSKEYPNHDAEAGSFRHTTRKYLDRELFKAPVKEIDISESNPIQPPSVCGSRNYPYCSPNKATQSTHGCRNHHRTLNKDKSLAFIAEEDLYRRHLTVGKFTHTKSRRGKGYMLLFPPEIMDYAEDVLNIWPTIRQILDFCLKNKVNMKYPAPAKMERLWSGDAVHIDLDDWLITDLYSLCHYTIAGSRIG